MVLIEQNWRDSVVLIIDFFGRAFCLLACLSSAFAKSAHRRTRLGCSCSLGGEPLCSLLLSLTPSGNAYSALPNMTMNGGSSLKGIS